MIKEPQAKEEDNQLLHSEIDRLNLENADLKAEVSSKKEELIDLNNQIE
jgi:hypothetical protein